jgi:hypothetical protein
MEPVTTDRRSSWASVRVAAVLPTCDFEEEPD